MEVSWPAKYLPLLVPSQLNMTMYGVNIPIHCMRPFDGHVLNAIAALHFNVSWPAAPLAAHGCIPTVSC